MEPEGIKSAPFKVKAAGSEDGLKEGQFEGYASVFGNVDSYGDVVVKGAFAKTLEEWSEKGDPIPLLWGHDFDDPFSNVGSIDFAEEDDHGLKVRATFDLENPKAAQVYRLAKGRRVTGMSFAYTVRDSEQKDDANHLKDLHIFEASIVPIGANSLAGVEAVKAGAAALVKAEVSGDHVAALREARNAIDSVLSSIDGDEDGEDTPVSDDDQEKQASGSGTDAKSDASDEHSSSVSDEELKSGPSVARLAAQAHIYELMGSFGKDS